MKTKTVWIALLLCVCLLLGACGGKSQEAPKETVTTEAPRAAEAAQPSAAPTENPPENSTEPAPTETETVREAASSPFLGNWRPYAQEGEISLTHEQVLAMNLQDNMAISFYPDGSQETYTFGTLEKGPWTDAGDGSGVVTIDGENYSMRVEDGFLIIDMGNYLAIFDPAERAAGDLAGSGAAVSGGF